MLEAPHAVHVKVTDPVQQDSVCQQLLQLHSKIVHQQGQANTRDSDSTSQAPQRLQLLHAKIEVAVGL